MMSSRLLDDADEATRAATGLCALFRGLNCDCFVAKLDMTELDCLVVKGGLWTLSGTEVQGMIGSAPALSLLSDVKQNTASSSSGVLAPPVNLDSLTAPGARRYSRVTGRYGDRALMEVDAGLRVKGGRTLLLCLASRLVIGTIEAMACGAGKENVRRSRVPSLCPVRSIDSDVKGTAASGGL